MTKIVIIGSNPSQQEQPNRIRFISGLGHDFQIKPMTLKPSNFSFIELICLNYSDGKDLMFAYNDPINRGRGTLAIGHFNDGIV